MGRKVKCAITHEIGTSDVFYRASDGKYYKSRELYEFDRKQKEGRQVVIDTFCYDFLGYKKGMVFPTILTKKLKELEFYGYDVINKTIERCRDDIVWAIKHKEFNSDVNKISYIMAIIKNNINDVNREVVSQEKRENKQIEEFANVDVADEESLMNIGTKTKPKDISDFLED